ncbi:MAG: insulinase family protein, partial [Desulfobacterales bacterium]|nr:insulinase family protein [Desulfobacterales bacterium]
FARITTGLVLTFFLATAAAAADPGLNIHLDVKEFALKNGMLFLVVERPATPQVSVRLAIRAGSALEDAGRTGIAHMLEHMMFKGTRNFGTTDPQKDEALQKRIDAAYNVVLAEQAKRSPDAALIRAKLAEMETLRLEAQKLYVPQAFSSQLGRNGAVGVNAFTSNDQTQYLASVPADMLEQWFSIISEQLFEPSWREFYVEKEVVQREWAFRYVNNPQGAAWLDLYATAYTAHPYRNPVIGWKSDMERYRTQDAVDFHRRFYNPANAVCVLVGDLTVDQARKLAETYFERYPAGSRAPETVTAEPPQQGPRKSVRFLEGARTPVVRIGFHGAPMSSPDFFALDALAMVLSQGRSARLTQQIVNRGLAVQAWAGNPDNRYGGLFVLGGSPNEPEALRTPGLSDAERREAYRQASEGLEALLLAEVERLRTELVSERELERIKKLNRRDFIDRLRSNESVAGTLASLEVQVGWRYLGGYLERMDAVTAEEIRRAAQTYLAPEKRTTVYILPGGDSGRPAEAYTEVRSIGGSAADRAGLSTGSFENLSAHPTPKGWKHPLSFKREPRRVEYPAAERFTAAGAPVFFLSDPELPLVEMSIFIKAGAVDLREAEAGLTDLLSESIIRGGTESLDPDALALLLDDNAIQMSVSAGEEETVVRLSVLSTDWRRGLEILQEVLTRPRFDSQVLDVARRQEIVSLTREGESAGAVAMREAAIWHFKGHPYGRDPLAAVASLPAITREQLKNFIGAYFVPANMVVAVAGDLSRTQAAADIERFMQAFPQASPPLRDLPAPAATPPVVTLIHKPGQAQSQVMMKLPGLLRTDPDYWKLNLLMNLFGGGDSLMYTRLRDDLGFVYSAGFYQTFKWRAGLLIGSINCQGDKAAEAALETLRIMESLRRSVPERELERKRLDLLNSFVFNLDTKSDLVQAYARYLLRGEPLDTLGRIQDAFAAATGEELVQIAGRLLDPRKLQVHVVADKSTPVAKPGGKAITLEEDLKAMASSLNIPFREIELR